MRVCRAGCGLAGLLVVCLWSGGCAAPGPQAERLRLGGAQVSVELVASWLGEAKSPAFVLTQVPPIYMSQHGFEALARDECDLACADRLLTARELGSFGERRVSGRRIAFYGYALYVHPSNPLDALFAKHLRLIYQRRVSNWETLLGDQVPQLSGPIKLYGPPKSTRAGSILSPLAQIWFADATWEVLPSDQDVIAAVAADPQALGFATIGYEGDVRALALRMEERSTPVLPSLEAIEQERYGLAKVIYVYYIEPPSPAVSAALAFLGSARGRAAIEETDLWAVEEERAVVPPPR